MGLKVPYGERLVDSELITLDNQARDGDAVSGWRGDPSMWVNHDPVTNQVQVFALDKFQKPYIAASCHESTPGFRHVLLGKLVKGDWQKRAGNLIDEIDKANAKVREDADKRFSDWITGEFGDKLHHALVKDGVATRSDFYMTPRKGDRR